MSSGIRFLSVRTAALTVAIVVAGLAGACSTSSPLEPKATAPAGSAPVPGESGFLSDYSKLQASEEFAAVKFYRDDSRKGGYRRLYFRPVEVWRGSDRRLDDVPEEDLQYLADSLYRTLDSHLRQSFEMVDKPGPGVLEIHTAFTLVPDPESPVDFFSTAVPVTDLVPRKGPLAEGTKRFVRSCAFEAEFLDATSAPVKGKRVPKEVRAAFFDVRRGSETPKGNVETWQDLDAVFEKWGAMLDQRLVSLRDGTFKPRLTVKKETSATH